MKIIFNLRTVIVQIAADCSNLFGRKYSSSLFANWNSKESKTQMLLLLFITHSMKGHYLRLDHKDIKSIFNCSFTVLHPGNLVTGKYFRKQFWLPGNV